MKALLLVDVQNDFLPGGALAVPEGDQIIPVLNGIVERFDLVVATQDWHPANHLSFASNHPGKKAFEEIELHGLPQTLWPDHCVQDTPGAEFSEKLNSAPVEVIFRKGTDSSIDSYSGFYDNGHRKSTGLSAYLKGKGIERVFLTGLAGDICVYYSALDALKEGFETTVIRDGCRPLDKVRFEKQLEELQSKGATVIDSKALTAEL